MKLSQKQHQRLQQAFALHESGNLEAAAGAYRSLLRMLPGTTILLSNLGMVLLQMGLEQEGVPLLERSLRIDPAQPEALAACAMAHVQLGQPDAALAECARALQYEPSNVTAHHAMGLALHLLERYEEALASYANVLQLAPTYINAWCNRGLSLVALERFEEALDSFEQALKLDGAYVPALTNRMKVLRQFGLNSAALEVCERVCLLVPDDVDMRFEHADLLFSMRRFDQAGDVLQALAEANPDSVKIWRALALALNEQKQNEKALACFERALDLDPNFSMLRSEALRFCLENCYWPLLPSLDAGIIEQMLLGKVSLRPFESLQWKADPKDQLRVAQYWAATELGGAPMHNVVLPSDMRETKRRLKVGFISSDFHNHPVGFLLERFLPRLNRECLHLVGVQTEKLQGAVPESIHSWFDSWVDIARLSVYDAEARISEECLDIAINLNGITAGERMELFAMRVAPLQVSFLGYAGTTGVPFMDYVVADEYVLPSQTQPYYSEQVAYLPDTFFVPNLAEVSDFSVTRQEEGLPETGVVFCCFNNSYKITPDAFDIWMRLLESVPGSVLWLSQINEFATENLKREATVRHIDPDRLVFARRKEARSEHLRRLQLADIFLDTFYYNAHTTASDALWAGVPVLTCPGETFASRVAGSLLKAAGMDELIADSREAYEAKALQMARDPGYLADIRTRLAQNKSTYPIFDMQRYARNFEALLWKMWQRYTDGLPPGPIRLSDGPTRVD